MKSETNIKKLRKEALKLRDKFIMRSCWNCNPAHEHLKDCSDPIMCFACGHWYFKGVDIGENGK